VGRTKRASPGLPLVPLLLHTAKLVGDRMAKASTPRGTRSLSFAQATALLYVAGHADATSADLSRVTQVSKQATSELVSSLESEGLLRREPHARDRRSYRLVLTAEGQRRLDRGHAEWKHIEEEWASTVGHKRMDQLKDSLERFLEAAGATDKIVYRSDG